MRNIVRASLAGVAAAATAIAVVGCAATETSTENRTLTVAVSGLGATFDPLQGAELIFNLQRDAVFDTLLDWDVATDTGKPWLAEQVTYSDDRLTMEIKLREDVDFVDGVHLDAAALETYLDALFVSQYVGLGAILPYEPEATATGEYTVEITTTRPTFDGDFGRLFLGSVPILSPGALDDPERAAAEPMGTGPYLIEEFVPEVEMTLVRNPDYWNPEAYPYDTVVLKIITDPTASLNALNSGQVDATAINVEQAQAAEDAGLTVTGLAGTYHALYIQNPADSSVPALRDPRVRQAIMLAFDRQGILDSIQLGYGILTDQAFGEGAAQYIEGADDRYGYDPERARDLLAEAGYPDGFDITIPVEASTANYQPAVEQALAEIGIRVTYEAFPDFIGMIAAQLGGEYPVGLVVGQPFADTLRILTEEFPGFGQYIVPTPEVADLVSTIKGADPEASAEASQELGELLLDEAWIITFAAPLSFWASTSDVDVALEIRDTAYPRLRGFTPHQ